MAVVPIFLEAVYMVVATASAVLVARTETYSQDQRRRRGELFRTFVIIIAASGLLLLLKKMGLGGIAVTLVGWGFVVVAGVILAAAIIASKELRRVSGGF